MIRAPPMGRKSRMGQESRATIVIRPCRVEECAAVLALWERAGAIPSPTDTLEGLQRLLRTDGAGVPAATHGPAAGGRRAGGRHGGAGDGLLLAGSPERGVGAA